MLLRKNKPSRITKRELYWSKVFLYLLLFTPYYAFCEKNEPIKVVVVGDTGIGERAFYHGFRAVAEAMDKENPDLIIHLGDFVYQPEIFPKTCETQYKNDIFQYLVRPFPLHLFVLGDNDLTPTKSKPKASGCWNYIKPLAAPFDKVNDLSLAIPGPAEGTKTIDGVLFAIINIYNKSDPTPWLKPRVEKARLEGKWIIICIHEPPVTTAWFIEKRQTDLRIINQMKPDFVFSGNQHSYERFHPMGIPDINNIIPTVKTSNSQYKRGTGSIHIVTGGGGSTLKPFADLQGNKRRTAPKTLFNALAVRAIMNHYVVLEISDEKIFGRTEIVCPEMKNISIGKTDPRWKPNKNMWSKISLACDRKSSGKETFDRFTLTR
tara:strand:- start:843 stop:1973 length:1131 start_codon:yes stop_codon:yes gene_type:complete